MPRTPTRTPRQEATISYRVRVLAVVEASPCWMTGKQIAEATGLTYKQAIDALNALNNMERIARTGRKFTARWGRLSLAANTNNQISESFALLNDSFRSFFK